MSLSQPEWSCPAALPQTDYMRDSLQRSVANGSLIYLTFAGLEAPIDLSLSVYRGEADHIRRWAEGADGELDVKQVACWINMTTVTNTTDGWTYWFGPLDENGQRTESEEAAVYGFDGDVLHLTALGANSSSDTNMQQYASSFRFQERSAGVGSKNMGIAGWGCLVLASLAAIGCTV